jgi:fido (protein-threonine AMPylation protein)
MGGQRPGRGRPSRSTVFTAVDQGIEDLARVGGLPHPAEADSIWRDIWHEETHNSTAIEGNTLILRQVAMLLEQGRAVGNKELREYLEVQAYADAAQWVYEQASSPGDWSSGELLTITELREIHRRVVERVWKDFPPDDFDPGEGPGSFRRHDIAAFPGGMRPPPFVAVPGLVDDWIGSVNAGPAADEHLVQYLARAHTRFEAIHPFRDGNGRTGRLVMNLLLVRQGLPPAIIYNRERAKYIDALIRADQRADIGALAELIARSIRDSIDRFVLPALAGPNRMVPLVSLVSREFSAIALRNAAERGRLRAQRRGTRWYSTRQWVDEYAASRHQRRHAGQSD